MTTNSLKHTLLTLEKSASQNITPLAKLMESESAVVSTSQIHQDRIMSITAEEDQQFTRWKMKRLPHQNESLRHYLYRVEGWKLYAGEEPPLIDRCTAAIAGYAWRRLMQCRTLAMALEARIVTGGICCCTDAVAHERNFNTCPSLLAFQETARKGCVRCWYITQGIAVFAERMQAAVPSDTQVHLLSSPLSRSTGSVHQVRIRWPETGIASHGRGQQGGVCLIWSSINTKV